jgi:excisionase family DNA binding protein
MDGPKLAYRITEACQVVGVGRTTLYSAIKRGDLQTAKVGRRTIILAGDLQAWLSSLASAKSMTSESKVLP